MQTWRHIQAGRYIQEIRIHLIKSCAISRIESVQLVAQGLAFDRWFMVTDPDGRFITQRAGVDLNTGGRHDAQKLALVTSELTETHLIINAPGMPEVLAPLNPPDRERLMTRLHKDTVGAVDQGKELSEWFSTYLSRPCRFVRRDPDVPRYVKGDPSRGQVGFADGRPLLVITQASVDRVNRHIENPSEHVTADSFRPNLVIGGDACEPHEEERYVRISVGTDPIDPITIWGDSPCVRCSTIMVDQSTGVRGKQPMSTLYGLPDRVRDKEDGPGKEVVFGMNCVHKNSRGVIRVGDPVRVLEWN